MTQTPQLASRIEPDRESFLDLIRPYYKKIDQVKHCMQCGTCTGGCPTAMLMDHTPRTLIYMINLGLKNEVLHSNTLWTCVNCYTCSVRCPRDIKVSEVFDALRALAFKLGYMPKNEQVYHNSFTKVMDRYGRVFEAELMIRYSMARDPLKLMKESFFGLDMIMKGKMHLLPTRVKGLPEDKIRFHNK